MANNGRSRRISVGATRHGLDALIFPIISGRANALFRLRAAQSHDGRVEIRPHVRTALAADRADEARLKFGQPEIIGASVAAHRD